MRWLIPSIVLLLSPAFAQEPPLSREEEDVDFAPHYHEVQPILIGGLEGLQARLVYPEAALRDSVEGRVVVQFVVTEAGEVEDAEAIRSPDERLSEAALDAIRASRFIPGEQRGRPVKVRFAVPVAFRLRDAASEAFRPFVHFPELVGGMEGLRRRAADGAETHGADHETADGVTDVRFVVDERGEVVGPEVARSSGSTALDAAALDAIHESRFAPGSARGRPRRFRLTLPVAFGPGALAVQTPARRCPEITEIVDTQPEWIGGLDGLHRRLDTARGGRRAEADGVACVEFAVTATGETDRVRVWATSPLLEHAAEVAIRQSRFTPGILRGRPTDVFMRMALRFRPPDTERE